MITNEVISMKKQDILSALQLFLAPILVILLGLLLLINPDSASVLISRLLGGLLTLLGIGTGIAALFSEKKVGKLILAFVLFGCGGILAANPLLLASFAGRVVGILLFVDGLADLVNAHRRGIRGLMPLLVTILGGILIMMPMTASRLVFGLCGLAVTVTGVFMLLDRLRRRLPRGNDDPNIIDAL